MQEHHSTCPKLQNFPPPIIVVKISVLVSSDNYKYFRLITVTMGNSRKKSPQAYDNEVKGSIETYEEKSQL